jgi:hypothetical protein
MNPDTRVAVCCYEGDQHQVVEFMDLYTHHKCPIVVLSPENSKANIPGVENRHAGKRAYSGPDMLDRFMEYLKILLTFPENHFFIADSDSFCLEPKLPDYLYENPDIVWSNMGYCDDVAAPQEGAAFTAFAVDCPHVSLGSPWFLSRKTIEALLAVTDHVPYSTEALIYTDLYLVQLCHKAGLRWRGFYNRTSFRIDVTADWATQQQREEALQTGLSHARAGANMMHSIKSAATAQVLLTAYNTSMIAADNRYLRGKS